MTDSKLKIAVPAKVDQALGRLLLHGEDSARWEEDVLRVEAFIDDLRGMADKAAGLLAAALPDQVPPEPDQRVADGE